jgi:Icc-related predicted phosphoesterase
MKILAVADVHSPRYLDDFVTSLAHHTPPGLFLMAGDMINRGNIEEINNVLDAIENHLPGDYPIISCYGNDEYTESRRKLRSLAKSRVTFLDEKSIVVEVDGIKVGVVGTQGSLDRPTSWQRRNITSIKRKFEQRADRAASLLKRLVGKVDRRILLMHYSPCMETCAGEDERAFAWLGSKKFYSVIISQQPDLVIHGHVHNSSQHEAIIENTLVRNVAFPAIGDLTELDLWSEKSTRDL